MPLFFRVDLDFLRWICYLFYLLLLTISVKSWNYGFRLPFSMPPVYGNFWTEEIKKNIYIYICIIAQIQDLIYRFTPFYSITKKKEHDKSYKIEMQIRKLIITSILKKKYYKQVDYLPHTRVSPILQIRNRVILRYFSLFNFNLYNMYRISVWQCMYFLPPFNEKSTRVTFSWSSRRPFGWISSII